MMLKLGFTGVDDAQISSLTLERAVTAEPHTYGELVLVMQFDEEIITKLFHYIAMGKTTFILKGNIKISIFDFQYELPFRSELTITREQLGI